MHPTAPSAGSPSIFPFDNSYARMPERFFARLSPTPVAAPRLIRLNEALARDLGLDPEKLATPEGLAIFSGNAVPSNAAPLAMAYAGHQFGNFVPQLGDGRAILLGEIVDRNGVRRDVQLKGSGPTPFSRNGDGRAALGPVLREYIISEAMAAFGIPTTRALAAVTTGEIVRRERALPGAVLTRIASSHIRVGTFQFFAVRGDVEALQDLVAHVIARHYPEAADSENPAASLLEAVMARQADLVARWMHVGFIHGVMNTDNMSIAGETIDFGPCAFIDTYDPEAVYSSIDSYGRYAFRNQPRIARWNLARFAEALLPVLGPDQEAAVNLANTLLGTFSARFEEAYQAGLRRKLGLHQARDDDAVLAADLLARLAANGADYTLTFRKLSDAALGIEGDAAVRTLFADPTAYDAWAVTWRQRLADDGPATPQERARSMNAANPAFIPRNHLVEEALAAAVSDSDYTLLDRLLDVLAKPFEDQPGKEIYATPPRPEQIVRETFCGT